ncbi:MAG: hypothetical protein HY356_08510 [Gammaproteobacteria bacterium]|nr:hypothetical protein [Gammaproteobacteria bacterium]
MKLVVEANNTLLSILTCPLCGYRQTEVMPIDYCQWYYECLNCHVHNRPRKGDCCVFCSYGSSKCPSKQNCGTASDDIHPKPENTE